jgi:hypothetical protein
MGRANVEDEKQPKNRLLLGRKVVLDDGCARYRHRDLVILDDQFAPGDGVIVGEDPDLVIFLRIELDDGTPAHPQQLLHRDERPAQKDGYFDPNLIQLRMHAEAPI